MIRNIVLECSQFIKESEGNPVVKYLPQNPKTYKKVKARKKKSRNTFDLLFNTVFEDKHSEIRQRAIFVNGYNTKLPNKINGISGPEELYYIFPINGYKYIYSPTIVDSSVDYQSSLNELVNLMEDDNKAITTFKDILKFEYTDTDLTKGILANCEIIFYNVPYFYAAKVESIKNYSILFSL